MNKTSSICRWLWIAVYLLLIVMLGIMIILSITEPQHNLFAWQMALGTVLGTIAFISAFFIWQRYIPQKLACNTRLYYVLLVLLGISLYLISCIGRNSPESFMDYNNVWQEASELAQGKSLSQELYFKAYANNITPMLFLSVLFRVASLLHIKDPFYFVLAVSVLEVMGAVWSVGILVGNSVEERRQYRIPVLTLFACLLPMWANTQAFYTDSMSFCMGAMALAGIKLSFETDSKIKRLIFGGGQRSDCGDWNYCKGDSCNSSHCRYGCNAVL